MRTRKADADGGEEHGADAGEEKDDSHRNAGRAQQLFTLADGTPCDDQRHVAARDEQIRPAGGDACGRAFE